MNKIAFYLQEHISGEVMTATDARKYFSSDNSIFNVVPSVIVYPKNENDVRKAARFTWQLAERDRYIPVTSRGNGSDLTGAPLGNGVIIVYTAYMNKIKDYNPKDGTVVVEPGTNFGKIQHLLNTDELFIPAAPLSLDYSSIGGAVANNTSSFQSLKYGSILKYVDSLRVVLANGEAVEVKKLSKKELNIKLGLSTLEGDIYRALDTLIDENKEIIPKSDLGLTKNVSGYNLAEVKSSDGSFDLTPLFVGSQGTLGYITEITLDSEIHNPNTTLIVADIESIEDLSAMVQEFAQIGEKPSAFEMVDQNLLNFADKVNENFLKSSIEKPYPNFMVFIEYDNLKDHKQQKLVKKALKILSKYSQKIVTETDPLKQDNLWKIRQASALAFGHNEGLLHPLPLTDDAVVSPEKVGDLIAGIYDLYQQEHLNISLWGHLLDGNIHTLTNLNIAHVGDRQKAFRMLEDFSELVSKLGGSLSGRYNDGRLRGPYLDIIYPPDVYELFVKVKQIFDPFNILNPGVKINVSKDDVRTLLRSDYSLQHVYDHLPNS